MRPAHISETAPASITKVRSDAPSLMEPRPG